MVEVIGEGASQESAVVGEAPNLAARLQGLADSNSVVIDLNTRKLIAHRFDLDESGPHSLKGIEAPTMVWHVKGQSITEERTKSADSSMKLPMVGRDEELSLLLSRWSRTRQEEGQVVVLTGEPGIGKSRVSQAFIEKAQQDDHLLIRFYCSSYHTQSPLHPFISYIERQCGFQPDDLTIDKQHKLEQVVLKKFGYSRAAFNVIAAILSIELDSNFDMPVKDPVSQLALLQEAIIEYIVSQSLKCPVMFILEDVHWIDPTSKRCLDLLVDEAQKHSIFVLFSSRPTESFNYNYSHVTRLSLNKLSKKQVADMITSVARDVGVNEVVAKKISEKSDGIPLYIEEITKMLVAAREPDGNATAGKKIKTRVPDSLQASLLSRLDRLGNVKKIAQTASVVGDVFDSKILVFLCRTDESKIQILLALLVENEIIFEHHTKSGVNYRFRHALLRDAAYESLLNRSRTKLHGQAAQYLIELSDSKSVQDTGLIAHHYSESGNTEKAYEYWFSAGLHALESGATREAVGLLENAKGKMPESSTDNNDLLSMYRLHMALGQSSVASAGAASELAFDSFRNAENIGEKLNKIDLQVNALDYQFGMRFNAARLGESLKIAQGMLQLGSDNDHLVAKISGYQVLGMTYYELGQFEKARANLESALDTRGQTVTGINAYPSMTMDHLSFVLAITGEPDAARKMCDDAYASALTESDYSTATALSNGCLAQMLLGNVEIVQRYAGDLIVFAEEKGQYMYLNRGLLFKNLASAILEKDEQCLQYVVDAIQSLRDAEEEIEITCLLGFVAEVQISFQHFEDAVKTLDQALRIANKNEERVYEAELHRLKSELAMAEKLSNWHEIAKKELEKATAVATSQGAAGWVTRIAKSQAKLDEYPS